MRKKMLYEKMKSENKIISEWKNIDEPMVSIQCLTYNHEKYIRQAIEGFLMQKTNFPFEIIIHDDASIDNTAKIIKEYEEKYPNIIKAIYQTENQYSKETGIVKSFVYPIVKGKYIAICEGDDYWTDENKLQKQYDFMEKNPDYSLCLHSATLHYCDGSLLDYTFPAIEQNRDFSIEEIIMGDGGMFATNSVFAKRDILINKPECFSVKGFGDYQIFIYAAISGKVYCMADNMSTYNYGVEGSWTNRIWKDSKKRTKHIYDKIQMLANVDEYYDRKFHDIIEKRNLENLYEIYRDEGNIKKLMKKPLRSVCKEHIIKKIRSVIIIKIPGTYKMIKKEVNNCWKDCFLKKIFK